jgi:hypothetical protein
MSAYAVAHLREVAQHPEVLEYLENSAKMAAELRASGWLEVSP